MRGIRFKADAVTVLQVGDSSGGEEFNYYRNGVAA